MLHGTVRVNDTVLGYWSARRVEHPPQAVNTYEVKVEFVDAEKERHTAEGRLTHKFEDGALQLAASVLQWASDQINSHVEQHEEAAERNP